MNQDSTSVKGNSVNPMVVLFLVLVVDMIGFTMIIPFLTFQVKDLANPEQSLGIWVAVIMAAYAIAQFLFSPMWGGLSDRIGRRPVLMIGLAGNTAFFVLFGIANTLWFALIARFLTGLFNANVAVTRAYVADISTPEEIPSRMGILGAAFGLGFTIGPAIGGWLSEPAEWKWTSIFEDTIFDSHPYLLPCVVASSLSLFSFILAWRILEESAQISDKKKDRIGLIQTLNNNFKDVLVMLKRPIVSPLLWSFTFFWVGFTIMHATFILFTMMPSSDGGLGFNAAQNGTIFVSIGLIGAITQGGLIGPLTKKFGSTNLLGVGIILAGLGLSSIPYVTADVAWVGLITVTGFVAFGNGIAAPSRATLLARYSGRGELGMVMGVAESLRAMSSIVGVLLGGIVWDLTVDRTDIFDYHTAFRLCGIFALIGFCIFRFSKAWHTELDETE